MAVTDFPILGDSSIRSSGLKPAPRESSGYTNFRDAISVRDPNAADYQQDYFSLLLLLVLITLKINDDLFCALEAGGIDDLVDWPWIDDSLV